MDVSNEILQNHIKYGASDNTAPGTLSSSKSLNYAAGASINTPVVERITVFPFTFNFKDSVGLFGAENTFVRIDLDIIDTGGQELEINGFKDGEIVEGDDIEINNYMPAVIDDTKDLVTVNTFIPAELTEEAIPSLIEPLLSVDLINLRTGNQYVDSWFDVRLYTKNREEHAYDKLYCNLRDSFYIGFHARNTRRLPYNVKCNVGTEIVSKSSVDRRYLAIN